MPKQTTKKFILNKQQPCPERSRRATNNKIVLSEAEGQHITNEFIEQNKLIAPQF
jgi:hypothetical protein